jgi:hypothetical protein
MMGLLYKRQNDLNMRQIVAPSFLNASRTEYHHAVRLKASLIFS